MDRTYIESHKVVSRYLSGDLTVREAREFEKFCADNPAILESLPIPVRVKAKMQIKAAAAATSGEFDPTVQTGAFIRPSFDEAPVDDEYDEADDAGANTSKPLAQRLRETPPLVIVLIVGLALMTVLTTVYWLRGNALQEELAALQRSVRAIQIRPPSGVREYRATLVAAQPTSPTLAIGYPDPPQLIELRIDMSKGRFNTFLVTVDSVRDGRIMQVRRVARDSNGELRLSLNSSAFGRGDVDLRFAGYTWRGETVPVGWIRLGMN